MRDHEACQPAGQGSLAPLVTGWQLCWLFSSGHLADYPIAVASGFIAGTAPVQSFEVAPVAIATLFIV